MYKRQYLMNAVSPEDRINTALSLRRRETASKKRWNAIRLKNCIESIDKTVLAEVVKNYVDKVVLPTYSDLKTGNQKIQLD